MGRTYNSGLFTRRMCEDELRSVILYFTSINVFNVLKVYGCFNHDI
jgi:hypothetical protein